MKIVNMKHTMIKRFSTVISLWLIAVIAVLCVFGYQLDMSGFYIASVIIGTVLLSVNVANIVYGIRVNSRKSVERQTQYR